MTRHTPGPWKHNGLARSKPHVHDELPACAIWAGAGEIPIATCDFSVGRFKAVSIAEQDANARLIAAAPDLLAALQFYVAICGNTCAQVSRQSAAEAYELAQVAITKATT